MPNQNPSHNSSAAGLPPDNDQAANVIRQKIAQLYTQEPAAKQELAEAVQPGVHHSKHQKFMYELSRSGKPLAEIQTAWHNYYLALPDDEKHEVWQEFYSMHGTGIQAIAAPTTPAQPDIGQLDTPHRPQTEPQTASEIKRQLLNQVQSRRKLSRKKNTHSLLFGLGFGLVFMFILLFSFFNERFIAPFISPSREVSATPIIIDPNSTAVGPDPKIIIPKINVELPVVYDEPSISEKAVDDALERGVLHYATTPYPGQLGNGVIFGHSSNNILNQGKYKFAFVLLRRLEIGDTFMLEKDGKRYVYKIYEKKVVKPTDLSVLNSTDKPATFTLITCDPPGTSLNRLVVIGEQISPDPATNSASTAKSETGTTRILPSNSTSLWQRIKDWFSN